MSRVYVYAEFPRIPEGQSLQLTSYFLYSDGVWTAFSAGVVVSGSDTHLSGYIDYGFDNLRFVSDAMLGVGEVVTKSYCGLTPYPNTIPEYTPILLITGLLGVGAIAYYLLRKKDR